VKSIGLEFDNLPIADYQKFADALPAANFKDVGDATMRMRMIKSDEEVEILRQGARIADLGGEAVTKVIKEGVREYEATLVGTEVMVKEIARTFRHHELKDSKWLGFLIIESHSRFRMLVTLFYKFL
jgi:creatinase